MCVLRTRRELCAVYILIDVDDSGFFFFYGLVYVTGLDSI